MRKLKTLNEMTQLRASGFGQQWPRHGLKLLYWFAHDCVYFDTNNEMLAQCEPFSGDFGFHLFQNRSDENLLPFSDLPYYEVGNLNSRGANQLPHYVRKDYTGVHDDSNVDRIIVSVDDEESFDKVYITEHHDTSTFNHERTYRISRGLLIIIRNMDLDTFLEQAGSASKRPNNQDYVVNIESGAKNTGSNTKPTRPPESRSGSRGFWERFCTIL
ncbi:uncharacterized protein LOC115823822 [Chanos chanos]|uniref:Uncharacterized protein LOC115823822 n=1 Tax=Chanos chanos TaxID=29144 RepID=A0A6J2WE07_CHACN|nr:uncharacterized protein LOC115823822 [Chanos chanos]